jgi:3-deoxy-manno-octulosonate cytidylyltransferase (CMP-KDO synthetase)
MKPIVLIPARMAATRLPGKPLADISGLPMIVRVLRQAEAANIGPVAVAAGDPEIVRGGRGRGRLRRPDRSRPAVRLRPHPRRPGGARPRRPPRRGDQPAGRYAFVGPQVLSACASLLAERADCDIATAVAPEASAADRTNPDVVKAVLAMQANGRSGRALYFTRSTLHGDQPVWRHIGIYGYRREALVRFNAAAPSPLETREKLEQLRALELGMTIWAAVADEAPISVDNPADLEAARTHAASLP